MDQTQRSPHDTLVRSYGRIPRNISPLDQLQLVAVFQEPVLVCATNCLNNSALTRLERVAFFSQSEISYSSFSILIQSRLGETNS